MDRRRCTDWIKKFHENHSVDEDNMISEGKALVKFIEKESNGIFIFDVDSDCLVQNADADWSYVFDVVKSNHGYNFGNIVRQPLSSDLSINYDSDSLEPGMMYAEYDKYTDAVRLYIYTGGERTIPVKSEREKHYSAVNYDVNETTFHIKVTQLASRPKIESELIEGLRNRNGEWLEELHSVWE